MGDGEPGRGVLRLWPADAAARLRGELGTAGWQVDENADAVTLVDLSIAPEPGLAELRRAAAAGQLAAALLDGPALAREAVEAGAAYLHDLTGRLSLEDTLAAMMRGQVRRDRRADDGALHRWVSEREGKPLGLVRVQLLRLDLVNAAHGRDVGTALVYAAERRIASVLEALADEEDAVLVRVPGPGFAAAIAGPADLSIIAAARIEEALDRPFRVEGTPAILGTSIGLASGRAGDDAVALLARAERAAADTGGARGGAVEALAIDLHRGLAEGQVTLVYQPQASLATGRIMGVEALARWQHPELGPLGADKLFAAAEQGGIVLALSDHIQRLVLSQVATWPKALQHLRVSLNLTPGDLARPRFAETFLDQVDACGLPHGRLTLEITETGLMADLPAAAALLATLRAAGCRVAIDDFGTGYSSLAWLKTLPVDYLKLDKSLAQDIAGSERDRVVVKGAIDMARSLGLAVVAEGVETEEQRAALAADGCAVYQGFLLSEPLDQAGLAAFVRAHRAPAQAGAQSQVAPRL